MSLYEILILGAATGAQIDRLRKTIKTVVAEYELRIGDDVAFRVGADVHKRDPKASSVLVYFVEKGHADEVLTKRLLTLGVPTIPVVGIAGSFEDLPDGLKGPNGLRLTSVDTKMEALSAAVLECIGLMRQQRRVFISYRRTESRDAALQLHDQLAGNGFDVFLDTHDIRPGEPFQEVLWHRMTDSDVVVVLDTATYFERKWTREEFGKAIAKEIHILRIVWPGHNPTAHLNTGHTIRLGEGDLTANNLLNDAIAEEIAIEVERIRSRSIAARFRSLTGKLTAELTRIQAQVEGIGASHAIAVRLSKGRRLRAYPIVGVPTANVLHEIAERNMGSEDEAAVLVYDHAGIRDPWIKHLDWLDANISAVETIKVFEAALRLVELDT